MLRREKVKMRIQTGRPKSETISVLRCDSRLMYLACLTSKPRRNRFPIRMYIENILGKVYCEEATHFVQLSLILSVF